MLFRWFFSQLEGGLYGRLIVRVFVGPQSEEFMKKNCFAGKEKY